MIDTPSAPIAPPIDHAAAYAALTEDAINARQAMDTGRWLLGEYTRMVLDATVYGQHTIDEFADDIGVDSKRAYEYGAMASYYPPATRESLSELKLTYSHFREAKRLKDLDKSIEFLKTVALNAWTIRQTQEALKEIFDPQPLPSYSTPLTDPQNRPVSARGMYQWRGPATVQFDEQGVARLVCEGLLEFEPGTRLMVSVEEY